MPHLLAEAQRWERDRDLELQASGGGKKVGENEWISLLIQSLGLCSLQSGLPKDGASCEVLS